MTKKWFFVVLLCACCIYSYAQTDSTFVDTKYLDDQFYFGINYNGLLSQPDNFEQNGLSGGVVIGYIRDIPLNERRNVGFGVGLGYAYNAYVQNMKISKSGNQTLFEIVPSGDYKSNRFATHLIEMPIEFRWRTSTSTKYSFWRIYAGVKLGYVLDSKSRYVDDKETVKLKKIDEIDQFQYGLFFSVGYGSLNINLYYGLKDLFKDAYIGNESLDLRQLNVGFIFYIL